MRKTYILENLDCANCAAKIEAKWNALPQVENATILFVARKLRLTAEDPDALIPQLQEIARTVESGLTILPEKETHHHHEHHHECGCGHHHHEHHHECQCGHDHHEHHHECECGHHHDHHHECACGHDHHDHHSHAHGELPQILLGIGLFAVGLLLQAILPSRWFSVAAFVLAYGIVGGQILLHAAKNLIKGHVFDENFLMSIATIGAFGIGEFPEAVGVMLFFRIGEYFEHRAVERSRKGILEAVDLRPEVVTLQSGLTIPADSARIGDVLLVRPGDRIPLDSVVISGSGRIDTAPITGEPVPVSVMPGNAVISGCINMDALLTVRVEKELSESMVTRILQSMENAAAGKPKIDRFITRFARIYTPIVVGIAAATALIPSLVTGDWNYWVYTALSFLVMSCPCALVLSVPLAFFSGIGTGSKKGILFKDGLAIEALAGVKAVVMDKTGTVTRGDFAVQQADAQLLQICASCEQYSTHPVAQSIVAAAKAEGLVLTVPEQVEEIPGHGIRGVLEGKQILCGNEKLLAQHGICDLFHQQSGVQVHIAQDGQYLGSILVADTIKPDAQSAVEQLHKLGVKTAILTGDRKENAQAVAQQLGIDQVHAQLLPDEKLEKLQHIRSEEGAVLFVGDGINDAPVLAGADVGAAMGSGADAAIEAADVVFLHTAVQTIPEALQIARSTKKIAWQNIVFALAVKLAVMILGLLGCASMWAAVFADSGVAMLCVLNAIRMLYRKK